VLDVVKEISVDALEEVISEGVWPGLSNHSSKHVQHGYRGNTITAANWMLTIFFRCKSAIYFGMSVVRFAPRWVHFVNLGATGEMGVRSASSSDASGCSGRSPS